jgi:hypothetical protein
MSIPPNTLLPPKAPNLPVGPLQYEQRYQDQLLNDLRRYFNTLDNALGLLLGTGSGGGKYVRFPYGAFQSGVDQTATVNTATAMTFNVTDYSNDVSVASNSRITVVNSGIYNLQWSGQFENTDTQLHDASVWIRVNGTDVVGSDGLISVPNKHGGVNGHTIAAWNYFVQLNAGDYVELWWSTDDAQVSLQYYAAGTSPTRPTTASVIATLSFVSALPA